MRRFGYCLIALLTACGASEDGAVEAIGTGSGGAGTAADAASGGGGTTGKGGRADAGTGGTIGAGGSAGSSGSQGSGGSIVVRACDGLPAAGQWENITPPPFANPSNMETLAVVVSPLDQTVYAAAGNKTNGGNSGTGVYKSTDCGATFTLVSTGTNSDKIMSGDPWAMMIDPVNPNILYTNNGYGNDPTIYKSTNAGVDWTALWPHPTWKEQSHVQAIAMDPANPQHLALTFHNTCEAPYNGLCLSRSTDGGATWMVFNGPSEVGGWAEAATISILGATSYLFASGSGGFYTSDVGQTWSKAISDGFAASYAGSTTIAPDGTMYLAGANTLYKSNSSPVGKTWTQLSGPPKMTVIIHDDVSLYASFTWAYDGNPVWTAKLSDTTKWTNMIHTGRGANQLAYDSAHHIVYAANWGNGLWRLVTR